MSHFKGGWRSKIFINKGGERCWFVSNYRKGGRRQANDIKGGGRLDLCDIPLLTICKLYKHVICECIIDEWDWLTVYKRLKLYRAKMGLSITTFSNSRSF